jgi:hypothetical protein
VPWPGCRRARATDLPELAEADLDPLLALPSGVCVLDTRMRIEPRRVHDPYLRRLRTFPDQEEPAADRHPERS